MIDPLVINTNIRTLIRTLLNMADGSVRPANQNDDPSGDQSEDYATVLVYTTTPLGWDEVKEVPLIGDPFTNVETVAGLRQVTASVNFFRGPAYQRAMRMQGIFQTSGAKDLMDSFGYGFISAGKPQDLSAVQSTYFEARAQIDIDFYVTATESNNLDTFVQFPITVETETTTDSFIVIAP